jgi:hypothetical protein
MSDKMAVPCVRCGAPDRESKQKARLLGHHEELSAIESARQVEIMKKKREEEVSHQRRPSRVDLPISTNLPGKLVVIINKLEARSRSSRCWTNAGPTPQRRESREMAV